MPHIRYFYVYKHACLHIIARVKLLNLKWDWFHEEVGKKHLITIWARSSKTLSISKACNLITWPSIMCIMSCMATSYAICHDDTSALDSDEPRTIASANQWFSNQIVKNDKVETISITANPIWSCTNNRAVTSCP